MAEIKPEIIMANKELLFANHEVLKKYMDKKGLLLETIDKYNIGWSETEGRIQIPVYDLNGVCVNIRKYKLDCKEGEQKYLNIKGGIAQLYPVRAIDQREVIICEGEHDCLLLRQNGFNAITSTAGAGSWKPEWTPYFAGKDVVLIYDCDEAGRKGASKIEKVLMEVAATIRTVDLGLEDKEDVSDYFLKYGCSAAELRQRIDSTIVREIYQEVDVVSGVAAQYAKQRIKFSAVIVGKDLSPYQIPKKVTATCRLYGNQDNKYCGGCALSGNEKIEREITFDQDVNAVLKMINKTSRTVSSEVRKLLRVPDSNLCRSVMLNVTELQTVEDIALIPELLYDDSEGKYALRKCFYFGLNIQPNQSYIFKGTALPDPDNQQAVFAAKEAVGTKDAISRFVLDDETIKSLEVFRPSNDNVESLEAKMQHFCQDMADNVTGISKRNVLIEGLMLIYHSVLNFNFNNSYMRKGWLEMAVVGDTGVGKSETISTMVRAIKAGEFISSGESATESGILGGLQQYANGKWTVTWGKVPLNDRGLVVIDEMELLVEQGIVQKLSGVRSSGIAELIKIQTQKTNARTRLVWIANPIDNRPMEDHTFGVEVIRELFKTPQDIRRIDIAIGCSHAEVDTEEINKTREVLDNPEYDLNVLHKNILRAWNIKPEQVKFQDGVERFILDKAIELSDYYSQVIPLALKSDLKNKLARIAVAAATFFNSTSDGHDVLVKRCHVEYSYRFLHRIYDSPPMSFKAFSNQTNRANSLRDDSWLEQNIGTIEMLDEFLLSKHIQLSDIEDIFGVGDLRETKKIASELRRCGALKKHYTYYLKTPSFTAWLQKKRKRLGQYEAQPLNF